VGVNESSPIAEGIAEKSDSDQLSRSLLSCKDSRGGSAVNRLLRSRTVRRGNVSPSPALLSCSSPAPSGSASIGGGGVSGGGSVSGSSGAQISLLLQPQPHGLRT